jgi:hypothetical protein
MEKARGWSRVGLTTRQLMTAILFASILAMAVRQPTETDTWWHLKSGQLMWQQGQILRTDPFSHTVAGAPWINHGWLVQVLLWPIYDTLGLAGLAILLAGIVTLTFALVYDQCAGRPFVAAFAVVLAAIASSISWIMRPLIISFLLAASVAFLLSRYKRTSDARWLWPLPLLIALWVNCHGGFVIAFLLLGCYLAGEALNHFTRGSSAGAPFKPLLLATVVSVPAVLLNPYTWKMIPYAYQTVSIGVLQDYIQEWAAPNFHLLHFHPFIWLLLLTLAAMGLSPRRADWTELALVGLFAYMGLVAARNIALFALVAPPVLSRHAAAALEDLAQEPRLSWLDRLAHSRPAPRPKQALGLLNLLLLVLVLALAGARIGLELDGLGERNAGGQTLPVGAADYLRDADLPGQMFNSYSWGGYLIWRLYPDKPVFVDGRTDLYAFNSRVLEDYVVVHWIRSGWESVLERYGIGYVVTERAGLLDTKLAGSDGWREAYRDDVAVVYVREEAEP